MKNKFWLISSFLLITLVFACQPTPPAVPPQDISNSVDETVAAAMITATSDSLEKTLSVTPTETDAPTSTSTATATHTLTAVPSDTPTASPTATETATPLPPTPAGPAPTPYGQLIWPRANFNESQVLWRQTHCAQQGQNLSCEIEYRTDPSGCYVGMSCYDACGWYYSLDTIPGHVGAEYGSGPCW